MTVSITVSTGTRFAAFAAGTILVLRKTVQNVLRRTHTSRHFHFRPPGTHLSWVGGVCFSFPRCSSWSSRFHRAYQSPSLCHRAIQLKRPLYLVLIYDAAKFIASPDTAPFMLRHAPHEKAAVAPNRGKEDDQVLAASGHRHDRTDALGCFSSCTASAQLRPRSIDN